MKMFPTKIRKLNIYLLLAVTVNAVDASSRRDVRFLGTSCFGRAHVVKGLALVAHGVEDGKAHRRALTGRDICYLGASKFGRAQVVNGLALVAYGADDGRTHRRWQPAPVTSIHTGSITNSIPSTDNDKIPTILADFETGHINTSSSKSQ